MAPGSGRYRLTGTRRRPARHPPATAALALSITLQEAKSLLDKANGRVNSAVGHQSTAEILTTLLEVEIPVHRQQYAQAPGETALVLKLNGRAPEGQTLTREQMEEIGYSFKELTRLS